MNNSLGISSMSERTTHDRSFGRRVLIAGVAIAVSVVGVGCSDDGNDGWVAAGERVQIEAGSADVAAVGGSSGASAHDESTGAADARVDTDSDVDAPVDGDVAPITVEPTGVEVRVIAIDNLFRPEVIEVNVGDDVVWENRGMNEHDIVSVVGPAAVAGASGGLQWSRTTADGVEWGVSANGFQPGATFRVRFAEPGEYRYYCSVHGNERVGMPGIVRVSAAS
ncbi:MAG: plastocyanin/azurin family copper-binding protein [Actinomycetota bacterium]|nr:plastocyanin/azurin family copper-binding protein [Actinomycetota bacterium]